MKQILKSLISGFFLLVTLPLFLLYKLFNCMGQADSFFTACSQALSLLPGKTGSFARKGFYRWTMSHCDNDCFIGFGSLFSQSDTDIQQGVYIGPQCNIGKCSIGKDCLLGSGVHILSGKSQHQFAQLDVPVREQGGHFEKITLGEDSWLGNGAIVMANVGAHCVVAAGAVVINEVPDYDIVAGNPARRIGTRRPQ